MTEQKSSGGKHFIILGQPAEIKKIPPCSKESISGENAQPSLETMLLEDGPEQRLSMLDDTIEYDFSSEKENIVAGEESVPAGFQSFLKKILSLFSSSSSKNKHR